MGWPLSGNWDRATTPPGASTADLSAILAALCVAVNQREHFLSMDGSSVYNGAETSWTGIGHARPSAADFNGISLRGDGVKTLMQQLHSRIDFLGTHSSGLHWTNITGLWTPGAGEGAYDINKGPMYAWNWLRMKKALDKIIYLSAVVDETITTSGTASDLTNPTVYGSYDVGFVWGHRTDVGTSGGRPGGTTQRGGVGTYRSESTITPSMTKTWYTGKFLGQLLNHAVAFETSFPEETVFYDGVSGSAGTFTYTVNGVSYAAGAAIDTSIIPAGTDVTAVMTMTSPPTFTGTFSGDNVRESHSLSALISGIVGTFNMAAFLTDQT
jgi:hypothetical protein